MNTGARENRALHRGIFQEHVGLKLDRELPGCQAALAYHAPSSGVGSDLCRALTVRLAYEDAGRFRVLELLPACYAIRLPSGDQAGLRSLRSRVVVSRFGSPPSAFATYSSFANSVWSP